MRGAISKLRTTVPLFGVACLFFLAHPAQVQAQSGFCPTTALSPVQQGFVLTGGACTNGLTGSFSGAALASQALSDLSQSTTQETARNTVTSISERREKEVQRCAEGFSRVDGTCRRTPPPVAEAAPAVAPERVPSERHAPARAKRAKIAAVPREEAPPPARRIVRHVPASQLPAPEPLPIEPAVRIGTWTQVYGAYEKRDATGPAFIDCCRIIGAPVIPLELRAQSRTGTIGFQAGADLTSRGILFAGDGIIFGVMAGYLSSDLILNTAALSGNLNLLLNEYAHLNANLAGPTAGLYTTYFNSGFSTDFLLKVDVLRLNETFTDSLSFCACFSSTLGKVPFFGSGSTDLINATIASNWNYRFHLYPNFWIEPTVGAQYTNLSYGSGAARLGLEDGFLVMVQGGARFGTATLINENVLVTTTLTGRAYDNVQINGGFIPGASFAGNNILRQADEGQVRGRGVLAMIADFGQGFTSFVQGEVRGGQGLFGAGGRAGVRYLW